MHATAITIMRELVETLERNHQILRTYVTHQAERTRFDALARLTMHRATSTLDIYEDETFRERPAIGAMYGACDAALRLLHAFEQVPTCETNQQRLAWAMRDLRALISGLFEYVIVPNGEPILSVE